MGIISRFSRLVDSTIRSRGLAYFGDGAVRIKECDESTVQASVRGTKKYDVHLSLAGDGLSVFCSCPHYESRDEVCKHIWATLLTVEAKGYRFGSGYNGPVAIIETDPYGEGDINDYEYGDGGFDEDYEYEERRFIRAARPSYAPSAPSQQYNRRIPSEWKQQLFNLSTLIKRDRARPRDEWPPQREIVYVVNAFDSNREGRLALEVHQHEKKKSGEWSKLQSRPIEISRIAALPDPLDRQVLSLLAGARELSYGYNYYSAELTSISSRFRLFDPLAQNLIPMICATGRCRMKSNGDINQLHPLEFDDRPAWRFRLEFRLSKPGGHYLITGLLHRDDERMEISEPSLILPGGLVFTKSRVARLQDNNDFAWIKHLRQEGPLQVAVSDGDNLLKELLRLPSLPDIDLPEELRYEEVSPIPKRRLKVKPNDKSHWQGNWLLGEVFFDYGGVVIASHDDSRGVYQEEERRFILRDTAAEQAALSRLRELGFRKSSQAYNEPGGLELSPKKLPRVVHALVAEGWEVEAEGKSYRQPGEFKIEVSSGIDWFELRGEADFDGMAVRLPELLAALKRGQSIVQLGDGSFGLLPEDWLKRYGMLAGLGRDEGDHLKFTRSQLGLLDALLAAQPGANFDRKSARARHGLKKFEGIKPQNAPSTFKGELRGYQREGLGWLRFLQRFGFGGCLADDMGLGKTVMVLALLESRRSARRNKAPGNGEGAPARPSLVVVPKSIVFNWQQEAAKFTPRLRVLDHTGNTRAKTADAFDGFDLVLTTYGTLRRDALLFKDVEFDYVILDEAQAIKNHDTESAKAARLLRGKHRLALSGTPVENHLGELWSLFEFLNPGMLGASSIPPTAGAEARNPDEQARVLLARALRPFILRRTKEQVATELPPKLEQTIYCDMEARQRKLYNELRDHYRSSLLGLVESKGLARTKIQILEALLRLRQAACHPGLIDKAQSGHASAKLDVLLPQLAEVIEEGHKSLVFSQFTSMLSIVRGKLDKEGITYEYLDGRTRDRAACVERFQSDPDCKIFLISLKAGGLGLNLTAAEYVFLLDPWWNPAVEAQAIDRAYRIGQARRVFAYRLIARDTVEEKVLELQKTKRELADAIIGADNSLIGGLNRQDLELLLS